MGVDGVVQNVRCLPHLLMPGQGNRHCFSSTYLQVVGRCANLLSQDKRKKSFVLNDKHDSMQQFTVFGERDVNCCKYISKVLTPILEVRRGK